MGDISKWRFFYQVENLTREKRKRLRSDIAISPIENGQPNSTKIYLLKHGKSNNCFVTEEAMEISGIKLSKISF